MNQRLYLPYFSDDINGFYHNGIKLSCSEQVLYQTLRDYSMNYHKVLCNDINMWVFRDNNKKYIDMYVNYFNLNPSLYKGQVICENNENVEEIIKELLDRGKLVIFNTDISLLRTYRWYKMKTENIVTHKGLLIGYDDYFYYYIDSPDTRSKKGYMKHPENSEVGKIEKSELLSAFSVQCRLGTIHVNQEYINEIADMKEIIHNIVDNYYRQPQSDADGVQYIGKSASKQFIEALMCKENILHFMENPFVSILFQSRHKRLKLCLLKFFERKDSAPYIQVITLLDCIIEHWGIVSNLAIKYGYVKNEKIYNDIIRFIVEIDTLEQNLIEQLEQLVCI